MSYYNYVLVIFTKDQIEPFELDCRTAGQMLPAGAIPLAIANENTREIFEVVNDVDSEKIIDFIECELKNIYDNSNAHSDTYIEYRGTNWTYIKSA